MNEREDIDHPHLPAGEDDQLGGEIDHPHIPPGRDKTALPGLGRDSEREFDRSPGDTGKEEE